MAKTVLSIKVNDDEGNVYAIRVEGKLDNKKLEKIIQAYNAINSAQSTDNISTQNTQVQLDTFYSRLTSLIQQELADTEFTSDEAQEAYEDRYNEPVKLATVSTYLSRLTRHGILTRTKSGRTWTYKLQHPIIHTSDTIQKQ
ncbi:MAG: hypothetical protein QXG05_05205 [Nitrososphaerota archaeon]